jgi:hypothetical protein
MVLIGLTSCNLGYPCRPNYRFFFFVTHAASLHTSISSMEFLFLEDCIDTLTVGISRIIENRLREYRALYARGCESSLSKVTEE